MIANSQHMTFKTYQTLKYILIAVSSIAILNCSSSSGTTVPNAEPVPSGKYYKFQNGVVEGVDFETNSIKTGAVSTDKGFTYNVGDEKITFKIKDLIIGTFDITKLKDGETLLVSDIVGVERSDTVNKDVLKILRVLHSLDRDNDPLNGIFIDDDTKSKLVGLSEGKTKITENDIYELKALMVKAGKTLVVEKKARDYYKTKVLTPAGITPKSNPFTLEVDIKADDKTFSFQATGFTYDYTVDWGDGKIEEGITAEKTYTYAKAGTYIIKISGKFSLLSLSSDNSKKITEVLAWGDIEWKSFDSAFKEVGADTGFHTTDTPDLSGVTNMSSTFVQAKMSNVDFIEDWDISSVTKMEFMFNGASNFNGNISSWDVSKVTSMNSLFLDAPRFNQNLSSWNTSRVTNMDSMFANVSDFNQDLSSWDVSIVTNMRGMFFGARSFNRDLSGWNVSSVTNMQFMFNGASSFNQDLSGWNVAKVNNYVSFATGWGGSVNDIPPKFR